MPKSKTFILIILCFLLSTTSYGQHQVNNYETIRNGSFAYNNSAWFTMGQITGIYPSAAHDNLGAGMALKTTSYGDTSTYMMQQLYLPTNSTSAVFSCALKFEASQGAQFAGLRFSLASTRNNQVQPVIHLETRDNSNFGGYRWQTVSKALTKSQLTTLNSLRRQGQPVYLYIQLNAQMVTANIDSVSFKVSGSMQFPPLSGRIAIANQERANGKERFQIYTLDPQGTNARAEYQAEGTIYGLTWHPDGKALAFSSSQDMAVSPFTGGIYELRNGQAKKLTQASNHTELRKKGGPTGVVRGKVINGTRRQIMVAVVVEGAPSAEFVTLAPYPQGGHEKVYEIRGVVDAGPRSQTVHGREGSYVWLAPGGVDVQPGGTARAVDLHITSVQASYTAGSLSYSHDAQYLYFTFPQIMRIPASGGIPEIPEGWKSSMLVSGLAHNPRSPQLLFISSMGDGIWMTSPGGSSRQIIRNNQYSLTQSPFWTADGQGFVFCQTGTHNPTGSLDIHYHHMANGQTAPLTMLFNESADSACPGPEGKYIAFIRTMSDNDTINPVIKRELWVMQADNMSVMWPLITQGQPWFPRWK